MNLEGSPLSNRIIAAGVVIAFCYWAEIVVLTLILSGLLAYFLDPLVELLERLRVPRALGSLLAVLVFLSVLVGAGLLVGGRLDGLARDWPSYTATLDAALSTVRQNVERFLQTVLEVRVPAGEGLLALLGDEGSLRNLFLRGLGSLYSILWVAAFVPFLVFFMLEEKLGLWNRTLSLFSPAQRADVERALGELSQVLRGYIVGNVMVAGILVLSSWLFFWLIGLDYAFLSALLSGLLNLVPYLGAIAAWVPPFVVGLSQWSSIGPFVGVALVLMLFHLVAINALFPSLVGRRVHLNAVAVTFALLFWGWIWGGVGLILAIPILAAVKVVCDHVDGWRPLGRWLGSSSAERSKT